VAAAPNNNPPETPDPGSLIGRRLSILYRIENETHQFSEAAGLLERVEKSPGGDTMFIRKRNGDLVEVLASHVVKLKVIPEAKRR
jgi:hypothetical protein